MKPPKPVVEHTRKQLIAADALKTQAKHGQGVWVVTKDDQMTYTTDIGKLFPDAKTNLQVLAQCALTDFTRQSVVIFNVAYGQQMMFRVDVKTR